MRLLTFFCCSFRNADYTWLPSGNHTEYIMLILFISLN
ncbi:hypothetical protein NC99_21630 [Sunxiuqinia dokdonensis]|uniref:Uncharacterized protein n=1 Tax=Sunxiuqinia dokdonensis TaxID=1409788 RepID=A0A0L8V9J2_9BACT|nr:hypothetical protein NC99_21630 [Sunxiuqinia dokdonensis]